MPALVSNNPYTKGSSISQNFIVLVDEYQNYVSLLLSTDNNEDRYALFKAGSMAI